jgi:ferredoxin
MRRLRHLSGRHRTPSTNRLLGLLLAFNAGAINAGGFLVVGLYTSHMTGFVSVVADNLVLGQLTLVLGALGALLFFLAGAATTAVLVNWARQRQLSSGFALPLLLEAGLLLTFGLVGATPMQNRLRLGGAVRAGAAGAVAAANLAPEFQNTPDGMEAEAILRKCVHCGFCTATCPTYQLLGDELDGPRGRIYLMKQVLEGETPTRKTQLHLDRCLTCRNCETTCPSGVEYGHLVDIGRKIVEKVGRPRAKRALRWALKEGLPSPLFGPAMALGQSVRGLLPGIRSRPRCRRGSRRGAWPTRTHARKVLMLAGCVQPAMMPNINSATARVLDAAGIQTVVAGKAGCCGAVKFHLNDQDGGLAEMRATSTPGGRWWSCRRSRPS